MADKKPEADAGGEAAAPPKKKKLLLMIIVGVLVLVLGGGGAMMMLKKKPVDEEGDDEHPAKEEKSAKKAKKKDGHDTPPVFVKLDAFTVKLQVDQQEAYLQTTPELRVVDLPVGDKVKAYMPEIRHKITLILMSRKAADISGPVGVQKLANEIRVAINRILDGPKTVKKKGKKGQVVEEEEHEEITDEADPSDSVQAVLFTSFIIQ